MTIGQRIKELRLEKEITQASLAKHIGVTQKAIDFWEKNINEPKASYIINIAKFFNVTTDFLLGIEDENGNKTKEIKENTLIPIAARSKDNKKKNITMTEEQLMNLIKELTNNKD